MKPQRQLTLFGNTTAKPAVTVAGRNSLLACRVRLSMVAHFFTFTFPPVAR